MLQTILFLVQEGSTTILSNLEKAGIGGLLISGIVWLARERSRLEKDLKEERGSRINELINHSEELSALLQKVMVNNNENTKETENLITAHEKSVIEKIKEMHLEALKRIEDAKK